MKYEYKKVTGYEQKKFIENGHTMFEEDVLNRLKRLVYLEQKLKQVECNKQSKNNCNIMIDSFIEAEVCKCGSNLSFVDECKLYCSHCRKLVDVSNLQS